MDFYQSLWNRVAKCYVCLLITKTDKIQNKITTDKIFQEAAEREADSLRQQITKMMSVKQEGDEMQSTSSEHNPLMEAELRAKDKHASFYYIFLFFGIR